MFLSQKLFEGIGKRVRKARHEQDLTLKELGEKCSLTRHTIFRLEKGHNRCSLDTFLRVCIALRTTPDEILTTNNEDDQWHLIQKR